METRETEIAVAHARAFEHIEQSSFQTSVPPLEQASNGTLIQPALDDAPQLNNGERNLSIRTMQGHNYRPTGAFWVIFSDP